MCQEARSAHRYLAVTKETLRLLVSKIVKYAATVVWEIHGLTVWVIWVLSGLDW